MNNPFAYSNYVTGESFCNRENEIAELMKYIRASQNVLLYSHRRYGKSSLIEQLFKIIKNKKSGIGTMHVDLYGTVSEKDFITRTFQSLNQIESNFEKLFKMAGRALRSVKFNVNVDPDTGKTTVAPSFEAVNEKVLLEGLMNILKKYSEKRKISIAFDEFQEIANYAEEGFEKRLRSYIQQHSRISYIFAGSQQHLITEMFNSSKRAFYKLAESFPLGKIETVHYVSWIRNFFKRKKMDLPADFIKKIVVRFENHPMYIQNFLFHLWEKPEKEIYSEDIIDSIEGELIDKKDLEYTVLWESLTINQKKTLKLILLNDGTNLYSADSLQSVNIKTASVITKTLSSLITKEIIGKNGNYAIQDILFKKWLMKRVVD